ncbi:MAG: LPXTG cell wall anchor domain-containing protein [Clostridia bacterium]|nr:LPXTG cell wall anchor domain-containing protein [Clostridia bacterium]
MKRFLALLLVLLCFAVPALAETALSYIHDNCRDVPFSNGYLGMDVDYGTENAFFYDEFTVLDTSHTLSNRNHTSIGNLQKIFATQYWDEFKQDYIKRSHYSWHFSDDFTGWRIDPAVVAAVKASDLVIPDHGYRKLVEEGMYVTFDFAHFETTYQDDDHPSFFGYKLFFEIDVKDRDSITLTPWNTYRFSAWQKLINGNWETVSSDKELTISNPVHGERYRFVFDWSHTANGETVTETFEGFEYKLVVMAPPVITSPTAEQTVTVQEKIGKVDLTIDAKNADEYEWQALLDGQWISLDDPSSTPNLGMANFDAAMHDGLKLRCVARNDFGEAVSPIFTLHVTTAPVPTVPTVPPVPQTGDSAPLALYAAAMLLAAVTFITLRRKAMQ